MELVKVAIKNAQEAMQDRLRKVIASKEGMTRDQYVRYLSMQYHLVQGVQRHFMIAASHPDMASRPRFREFLLKFAIEEEPHYLIAFQDLKSLGTKPLPIMLDVKLWWAYFDAIVYNRPFVRLGATCILENITVGAGPLLDQLLANRDYVTPKTTRFLRVHRHEELPHGDQILEALQGAHLSVAHINDLEQGAEEGATLFLRLIDWCLAPNLEIKRQAVA